MVGPAGNDDGSFALIKTRKGKPAWACPLCSGEAAHVREQLHLHAPVLLAPCGRVIRRHILILADADQIEAMRRNSILRRQVLHHCIRAALAQVVVVLRGTNRIRPAGHFQNVALRRTELAGKAVQLRFVIGGQRGLVKAEGH
jgi:hypothetical protein